MKLLPSSLQPSTNIKPKPMLSSSKYPLPVTDNKQQTNVYNLQFIICGLVILFGFTLRLQYLTTTHPFFDEYITTLAARETWEYGWPRLPSGLFYEHGLLATYIITPFTAMYINTPLENWQSAHWGLMLSRWPSLLISTLTIPLIFTLGRRFIGPYSALFAAAMFAFSPEGMVWGGRARMYALATLLLLLTVYYAYQGVTCPRHRWFALFFLALALLTQLGVLMLIFPLLIALVIRQQQTSHYRLQPPISTKFLSVTPYLLTLALIIIIAIFIKRLGQPIGKASLNEPNSSIITELVSTISYQTTFHFSWADTEKFLGRQFGVPHLYWFTIAVFIGLISSLLGWYVLQKQGYSFLQPIPSFIIFLFIIMGLIILEVITVLEPFRRNTRYLVMYLPLFYLITAHFVVYPLTLLRTYLKNQANFLSFAPYLIPLCLLFTNLESLRIALITPEPAYEKGFAMIHEQWQSDDIVVSMNTPAAGLYLNQIDGFTIEHEAAQFLLNAETTPIDRWMGVPWIDSAVAFNKLLNQHERVWFVSDTIRQPEYFGGSWQAIINSQMEQVLAYDNVFVYQTSLDRTPLPTKPTVMVNQQLGETIKLIGYDWQSPHLTLFWEALQAVQRDYTIFIHVRGNSNATLYQQDGQPLNGAYPTSQWQLGETIIDPISLKLPETLPKNYQLYLGLYNLDTLERLPVQADQSGEQAIILKINNEP